MIRGVTLDSLDKLPQDISADSVYTPTKNGITLYYSLHSPVSNFYKCLFHDDNGKEYNGVEQYYIHNNALIAKSLRSLDPDIRMNTLKKGMKLKYSQNPGLLACLASTKGTVIAEANPHDTFWGIGKRVTDESAFEGRWEGSNWAGKLTMECRDELCSSDSVASSDTEDMDPAATPAASVAGSNAGSEEEGEIP